MKGQNSRHVLRTIRHFASAAGRNWNQGCHLARRSCFAALPNVDYYVEPSRSHGLAKRRSVNRYLASHSSNSEAAFLSDGGNLLSDPSTLLPYKPHLAPGSSAVLEIGSSAHLSQSQEACLLVKASQLSKNAFRIPVVFLSTSREQVVFTKERDLAHGNDEPIIDRGLCKESYVREEPVGSIDELASDRTSSRKAGSVDHKASGCETIHSPKGWSDLGWTRKEVLNWPNAVSMARLISGPLLSWMIVQDYLGWACIGLAVAGISDWLDGFLARKLNIKTLLGSYLDPVADKILVGSVALSMTFTGLLHPALVALIVARDVGLMTGTIVYRAHSLGWRWNNWREAFRIDTEGAAKVKPLLISKFNTVLQLALVGIALLQPALSIEDVYALVPILSWSVVATTSMSGIAYAYMFFKDPSNLLALRRAAQAPGGKVSRASAAAHVK